MSVKITHLPHQAITTKYLGPTATKGSRIVASCAAGRVTIPFPYEAGGNAESHAMALLAKLDWGGTWAQGGQKWGYVFVRVMGDTP